MRNAFLLLLMTVAIAAAGPFRIQTQELVWTNGLDTLTLPAITVEGPGLVFFPIELVVGNDPTRRSSGLLTLAQQATLGDSAVPIQIRYEGQLGVSDNGQFNFHMYLEQTDRYLPYEAMPGPSVLFSPFRFSGFITGPVGTSADAAVQAKLSLAAPEPGAWSLMGIGLAAIVYLGRKFERRRI